MIFAKIDVQLPRHYRLLDISPDCVRIPLRVRSKSDPKRTEVCMQFARAAALGVWTAALCFTRDHMLDGFCPLTAISDQAPAEVVEELVRQGLFERAERDGRAGVVIVNYAKHNETKAEIERRLSKDRERKSAESAVGGRPDPRHGPRQRAADLARQQLGLTEPATDRVPPGFQTASTGIPRPESESETETDREELPSQAPAAPRRGEDRSSEHHALIAHYAAEFERLKGAKPVIGAKGGAGAKKLLEGRTLAEAKAIVDRALSDPWMLENSPDLAAIAGKINAFIGRRGVHGAVPRVTVQPACGSWKKAEIPQ
jgi:hypothetical protein